MCVPLNLVRCVRSCGLSVTACSDIAAERSRPQTEQHLQGLQRIQADGSIYPEENQALCHTAAGVSTDLAKWTSICLQI